MKLAVVLTHWRNGLVPSLEGQARLDLAATLLRQGEVDRVVIAGGLPDRNRTTLAAVYREYLLREGISGGCVILEDRSRDTAESLRFASELLTGGVVNPGGLDALEEIILISNSRHLRRARRMLGAMKEWRGVHVSFRASQSLAPRAEAVKEALFLGYTCIDPEWRSWLAERMRVRRQRRVARSD